MLGVLVAVAVFTRTQGVVIRPHVERAVRTPVG